MQSIDSKAVFVFVGDANSHHLEWLESVSPTDGQGRDALDFCNLAGCEQMVRGATHIAGNRLDLVMTDSPDVVDVSLGAPLGTSDDCFVNCELLVEKVIPEHNIRCVVHLKHRINWDNVRNAVRSLS